VKARHQLHVRRRGGAVAVPSYHAESSPNSSVILTATVLADVEDVLAVIRTAVLLGNNFRVSTSIDLQGEDPIQIEPGRNGTRASLKSLLDSIESTLCKHALSDTPVFAIETDITAASFLTAGAIAVHIRTADSVKAGPTVAR
jgi:hypothetical protein